MQKLVPIDSGRSSGQGSPQFYFTPGFLSQMAIHDDKISSDETPRPFSVKNWFWNEIVRDKDQFDEYKPSSIQFKHLFQGKMSGDDFGEEYVSQGDYATGLKILFDSFLSLFKLRSSSSEMVKKGTKVFERNNLHFTRVLKTSKYWTSVHTRIGLDYVFSAPFRILGWLRYILLRTIRLEKNFLKAVRGDCCSSLWEMLKDTNPQSHTRVRYLNGSSCESLKPASYPARAGYFVLAILMLPATFIALAATLVLATLFYGLRAVAALPLFVFATLQLAIGGVAWLGKALNHFAASVFKSNLFALEFGLGLTVSAAALVVLTLALGALGVSVFVPLAATLIAAAPTFLVPALLALSMASPVALIAVAAVAGFAIYFMVGLLLTNNNPVRFGLKAFLQSMFLCDDKNSKLIFNGKINEKLAEENLSRNKIMLTEDEDSQSRIKSSCFKFGGFVRDTAWVTFKAAAWPAAATVQAIQAKRANQL